MTRDSLRAAQKESALATASLPNGERIRRTTRTANKALALEFRDHTKAELWCIDKLGAKPKRSWNDTVVRWPKAYINRRKGGEKRREDGRARKHGKRGHFLVEH
jgi:hypothetical protein